MKSKMSTEATLTLECIQERGGGGIEKEYNSLQQFVTIENEP